MIIPVHSAEDKIDFLLDALCGIYLQDIKAEVFFVADRCLKKTIARLNAWCQIEKCWLRAFCIESDVGNPDMARGLGLRHATGKYLAFLDDDCVPSTMWVARGLELAEKYGAATGKVQHGDSFLQNLCAVMDFGEFQSNIEEQKYNAPGCNLIFRADLMNELGNLRYGYPVLQGACYGGDRILAAKLSSFLCGIHYDPELVVFHAPDLTLSKIWQREKRYGSVAWQVRAENPDIQWSSLLKTGFFAPFILATGRLIIDLGRIFQMGRCPVIMKAVLAVFIVPFRIAWFTGVFHCKKHIS